MFRIIAIFSFLIFLYSNAQAFDFHSFMNVVIDHRDGVVTKSELFNNHVESLTDDEKSELFYLIGYSFYVGNYPAEIDPKEAFYWLSKAAKLDHPFAQHLVSSMYRMGLGTRKNLQKAKYFTNQAKKNGHKITGFGSGFYINDNEIVTNKHVVYGCSEYFITTPNGNLKHPADLVLMDAYDDLAVLRSPRKSQYHATLSNGKAIKKSQQLFVSGFSKGKWELSRSFITDPKSRLSVFLTGKNKVSRRNRLIFTSNADITLGDSGSALIDRWGNIIGVMASIGFGDSKIGRALGKPTLFAVPIHSLKTFLKKNAINFVESSIARNEFADEDQLIEDASNYSVKVFCG